MADSIRGDGLHMAHTALATLADDWGQLDRARRRFSTSPPSYKSHQSHNSTLSRSPTPPDQELQSIKEREFQIRREHMASMPLWQYDFQCKKEHSQVLDALDQRTLNVPVGTNFHDYAIKAVKARWIAQGIWRDEWDTNQPGGRQEPGARWKHEDPYEAESETEDDTGDDTGEDADAEPKPFVFGIRDEPPRAPRRRPKSDEERQRIAERRRARERAREASRPFPQFVHQVSLERDQILAGAPRALANGGGVGSVDAAAADVPNIPDVSSRAYDVVRGQWVDRGIWNAKWGVLPGMTWKHEHPVEELLEDDAVLALARAALDRRRANERERALQGEPQRGQGEPRRSSGRPSPGGSATPEPAAAADDAVASLELPDAPEAPGRRRRRGGVVAAGMAARAIRPRSQASLARPAGSSALATPPAPAAPAPRKSERLRRIGRSAASGLVDASPENQLSARRNAAQPGSRDAAGRARPGAKPRGVPKRRGSDAKRRRAK